MMITERNAPVEFIANPEPRCPLVFLLDTSGSMAGAPITELNYSLQVFKDELLKDTIASRRVEVAVITFDSSVVIVQDFVSIELFQPPILTAQGGTDMGSGIETALDLIDERKKIYRQNGVVYFRPWIFMLTDGQPTCSYKQAAARIKEAETMRKLAFFAVGVDGANMAILKEIAIRSPFRLHGLQFKEMFMWLSASMTAVSKTSMNEKTVLPPPPEGWDQI
jgi:uncharacterized protein YegL